MHRVTCPQCGAAVAEGTAICPKCDHILDSSFLDVSGPAGDDDEPTHTGSKPSAAPSRPAVSGRPAGPRVTGGAKALAKPGGAPGGAAAPPRSATGARPPVKKSSTAARPVVQRPPGSSSSGSAQAVKRPPPSPRPPAQDEADIRTAAPGSPTAEVPSAPGFGMQRTNSGISIVAPEAVLSDAKTFVRELRTSDKLAFIGAAITVLLCFLPWKETAQEGEVLGFVSLGFAAFLANLVAMGAIVIRTRNAMPRLHPVAPWLLQLGSICFGIVWSLIFIKISTDGQPVAATIGNEMVPLSRASFGVYMGLMTQLVALAGTLMGLKEKPA